MLNTGEIRQWNCTKLRHFFESKSPKWMANELSLENVMALEMKLRECAKNIPHSFLATLKMVKTSIVMRDRGHNV